MKAILKAFRDALVANGTLIALVPATRIYAGVRDEKTALPTINVFEVSEVQTKLSGGAVGGANISRVVMQVSIFHRTEDDAQSVADAVFNVLNGDNTILRTAKIKNITLTNKTSLIESALSHIPLRFSCNYIYTT